MTKELVLVAALGGVLAATDKPQVRDEAVSEAPEAETAEVSTLDVLKESGRVEVVAGGPSSICD